MWHFCMKSTKYTPNSVILLPYWFFLVLKYIIVILKKCFRKFFIKIIFSQWIYNGNEIKFKLYIEIGVKKSLRKKGALTMAPVFLHIYDYWLKRYLRKSCSINGKKKTIENWEKNMKNRPNNIENHPKTLKFWTVLPNSKKKYLDRGVDLANCK